MSSRTGHLAVPLLVALGLAGPLSSHSHPASSPAASTDSISTVATATCGKDMSCVPGIDARITALSFPSKSGRIPAGDSLPVAVTIQNRGTKAAPAQELTVCLVQTSGCRVGSTELVELPKMAPGQSVKARTYVATPLKETKMSLAVVLDRDSLVADADRSNNARFSTTLQVELPKLNFLAVDVNQPLHADQPVVVHLRIQNRAVTAASPPAKLRAQVDAGAEWQCKLAHTDFDADLPTIAPRAVWDSTLTLRGALDCTNQKYHPKGLKLIVRLDPDRLHEWATGTQRSAGTGQYLDVH